MNIIERALEKLDSKGPDEDQADQSPGRHADTGPHARLGKAAGREASPAEDVLGGWQGESLADEHRASAALERSFPRVPRDGSGIRQVKLDLKRLSRAGMVTPENAEGLIAEQCRYIKRPLLRNMAGKGPESSTRSNLIMVTSALPGEGKTFMSVNLAMSLAMEVDRSVLLVDADIVKSDVCRVLGAEAEQGLTELLSRQDVELEDVLLKTDVQNLTILPAGRDPSHVTERFASGRMTRLVEEISLAYDIVLFDSMPLLARSGASVLAAMVSQIVLIVEAVTTPQRSVTEALGLIDDRSKIGFVLNKSRERARAGYRYGYYNYGRPKQ